MKLNPKRDSGLAALAILLGGLTHVNSSTPAEAAPTWCYELTNCTGYAGCSADASISGCTITCSGGGVAKCNWKSG